MESNNNYNINSSHHNKIKISIESVSQKMSEVCQGLSEVCQLVKSISGEDLSHVNILPFCDEMLSEMNLLVQYSADYQQRKQQPDEMWWDSSPEHVRYTDTDSDQSSLLSLSSSSDMSSDSNMTYIDSESEERQMLQEIFNGNMLDAITNAATGDIFNKKKSLRKRNKKRIKMVPKMLRSISRHCEEILAPAPTLIPQPILKPQVDWSKVNKRALDNLPEPEMFPVHSVSQDPTFYQETTLETDERLPPTFSFEKCLVIRNNLSGK